MDSQKPTLWVTKYAIQDDKHLSTLEKKLGILQKISTAPNSVIYAHVLFEDFQQQRYTLRKMLHCATIDGSHSNELHRPRFSNQNAMSNIEILQVRTI